MGNRRNDKGKTVDQGDENQKPEKKINKAVANLFFANPFTELGSTHPAIDKRISTLEKM